MSERQQPREKAQLYVGGFSLPIFHLLITLILAIGGGYGAARAAASKQAEAQENLKRELIEHKAEMERMRSNSVSKEQADYLLRMLDTMEKSQKETRDEIRALRQEIRR